MVIELVTHDLKTLTIRDAAHLAEIFDAVENGNVAAIEAQFIAGEQESEMEQERRTR